MVVVVVLRQPLVIASLNVHNVSKYTKPKISLIFKKCKILYFLISVS